MSNRDDFVTGGIRSIQSAYVDLADAASSTGTGEELVYWDITLGTTLYDYTKAEVYFQGAVGNADASGASVSALLSSTSFHLPYPLCKLTSNTNLRVCTTRSDFTYYHLTGRYYVKEWR